MPGTAALATESSLRLIPCSALLVELALWQAEMRRGGETEKVFTWDVSARTA